jgi:hypothetical protein
MTRHHHQQDPHEEPSHESSALPASDAPLEPWMLDLVREATAELDEAVEVPREMMWARIRRDRVITAPVPAARPASARRLRQLMAAAAVLVCGVAIGRYLLPRSSPTSPVLSVAQGAAADGADPALANDPSHVAMQEHLARTVSLLTTVSDNAQSNGADTALAPLARELLTTTRLLLDQPQLRDERTRRLLQDLELVLVQVIQARSTAPETQRAPRETLRETNLLTRVNALVTAASLSDAVIYGGD